MRKHYLMIIAALILFGFAGTAGAATISIIPTGTYSMAAGDTVSFDVLFSADDDGDTLTGLLLNLGYDAEELSFVSYSYDALSAEGWTEFFGTAQDVALEDGSYLANYNLSYPWSGSGYDVAANQSVSMGTFTFTATAGLVEDGLSDLWVVESVATDATHTYYSTISFNASYGEPALDLLTAQGADVAPVPVPAAAWLLGSGLIGLVGLRRRKA
ncbi:hypothetical protein DSCO28_42170 [Desulfosarcina ovata subsp. sediminis]|uniref:PEP-CTERM protein-sorting domain-containing protein n=1 Tax=Desulfosarcina ovata subsp. sediminis TaxID=885957 RepID=A0A5K7ZTV5_9BACT|nr:VPLPA-CTERM sorting domain-containing protein [Desulfosarcina ovata]BBO83651.1 hypothetical protein DSCO28_42170 [Desulfosarcina ovata subsp. sediminis]